MSIRQKHNKWDHYLDFVGRRLHFNGKYHKLMNSYFDCDNIGVLKEYVGCKIEKDEK